MFNTHHFLTRDKKYTLQRIDSAGLRATILYVCIRVTVKTVKNGISINFNRRHERNIILSIVSTQLYLSFLLYTVTDYVQNLYIKLLAPEFSFKF
jgi:hypothetical protein